MKADIHIFTNNDALSRRAAEIFVTTAQQAVQARERFLVALSGGSTPSGLYQLLASEPYRDQIDWSKTFVFWGDERCVPPDDEDSNYFQANEILLGQVPIPRENILRVKGELVPYEASIAYAQTLKEFANPEFDWPQFDLVLLGMGEDGHTASLFPGSQVDFNSPTLAVTADYQDRPANRVTLTPAVFNSARKIIFLVTGPKKATILSYVLGSESTVEQYPVQRIQPAEGQVIWLVDETAASKI